MAAPTRTDVIVVGGSAGALPVLRTVLSDLPKDLSAAILIVVHIGRGRPSALAELLAGYTDLRVRFARDGDRPSYGDVLIAPPDHHLILQGSRVRLTHGPRESGFRPAIDPLFRTAAGSHRDRVVGVVLSGALDDGSFGLEAVKRGGGLAVVQSPEEATFPSMPLAALQSVEVDAILSAEKIAPFLVDCVGTGATGMLPAPHHPLPARDAAEEGTAGLRDHSVRGAPSPFQCPECGGSLWEVRTGRALGYRCHVGHAYGAAALVAAQAEDVEGALWTALRTLEEAVALRRRMADHAVGSGLDALARGYLEGASDAQRKADSIRAVLVEPRNRIGIDPSSKAEVDDGDPVA
jgi:two-component system chemotaxis response regulator CheB